MFDDFSDLQRELLGNSPPIWELFRWIQLFGPPRWSVLIEGESGTGKELVARAIHRRSLRSDRLFVSVNCAGLTETIAQSELFGHERGAFTGADRQHIGWFERASGGTLFLDEIGDLPMSLQPALLRALQEKQINRVGGTQPIDIDVRIIAATNVNLRQAVAEKRFREDLYHRLNELLIVTPPLRERGGDILLLADHFIRRFSEEAGSNVRGISPEAAQILQQYPWPGNVRELENVIKRLVITASNEVVHPDDLPSSFFSISLASARKSAPPCGGLLWELEREQNRLILAHFMGNAEKAAEFLGRNYKSFLRTLKRFNLDQFNGCI